MAKTAMAESGESARALVNPTSLRLRGGGVTASSICGSIIRILQIRDVASSRNGYPSAHSSGDIVLLAVTCLDFLSHESTEPPNGLVLTVLVVIRSPTRSIMTTKLNRRTKSVRLIGATWRRRADRPRQMCAWATDFDACGQSFRGCDRKAERIRGRASGGCCSIRATDLGVIGYNRDAAPAGVGKFLSPAPRLERLLTFE